jgi:hypothetical protein
MVLHADEIEAKLVGELGKSERTSRLGGVRGDEDAEPYGLAVVHSS